MTSNITYEKIGRLLADILSFPSSFMSIRRRYDDTEVGLVHTFSAQDAKGPLWPTVLLVNLEQIAVALDRYEGKNDLACGPYRDKEIERHHHDLEE